MARKQARHVCVGLAVVLAAGAAGAAQTPRAPAARAAVAGDQVGAEAHFELGEMYHRQVFEGLEMAIKEYEEAVRLQPDFADAHYYLGLSYHTKAKLETDDQQLYRRALQEYKLYLAHSPDGELAAKAKQNIRAVEAKLREQRAGGAGATKRAPKAGGQR